MPPQNTNKPLAFVGEPGGFLVMFIVGYILMLIPLVGFAFSFNYMMKWLVANFKVHGQDLKYEATFGETWVMLFVGALLTIITFGIYTIWFVPKVYRYVCDHVTEAGSSPAAMPASPAPMPTTDVTPPSAPTPPTNTLVQ